MTNITPSDTFSTVQRYDTDDPVLGGNSGESSQPIIQLANRTEYINNRLGGYAGIKTVTADTTISVTDANKLIAVSASANVTLTINAVSTFKPGARIAVTAAMVATGGPFWVNVVPAENIADGTTSLANIWLYNGEMIEIVAGASGWYWTVAKGNFDKIGTDDLKRIQPRNTIIADGTLGDLRSKYPRLWAAVSGMAVSDFNWTASANYRYRAMFSTGNGTTTFRRPDMRAMMWRGLDLSRGISLNRIDELVGGYEADALKAHDHRYYGSNVNSGNIGLLMVANQDEHKLNDTGGAVDTIIGGGKTENIVKNIGLLPVIYY